jgi:hypothetical protein
MLDTKQREVAETAFDRNKRREAEINDALRQEQAPRCGGQEHAPLKEFAPSARCKIKERVAPAHWIDAAHSAVCSLFPQGEHRRTVTQMSAKCR